MRFTTCVVGVASSVNVSVAANEVSPLGVKVTFTTQLAPAATVAPLVHVVVPATMANTLGLFPPRATVVRSRVPVPPLVKVMVCGPLVIPLV